MSFLFEVSFYINLFKQEEVYSEMYFYYWINSKK